MGVWSLFAKIMGVGQKLRFLMVSIFDGFYWFLVVLEVFNPTGGFLGDGKATQATIGCEVIRVWGTGVT